MGFYNERIKPALKRMWKSFTVYESPKYVLVRDPALSLIQVAIQLVVLFYIFVWNIYFQSGYQRQEAFTGQATIKIKGNTVSESDRFFDAVDLVIPPQEEGGVFITTNYVHTPHQKVCRIPGIDKKGSAPAEIAETCTDTTTNTCPQGRMTANGISTGNCVWSNITNKQMCEIVTWCPMEDDNTGRANILTHTGNFTVFLRIDGRYPTYPYNPISNVDKSLVYNLNLFYVSDISAAGELRGYPLHVSKAPPQKLDLKYFDSTIEKGQIILVAFTFDCNLDMNLKKCSPKIQFQRIDDSVFSSGFNFRYSDKYYVNGEEQRDLWKIFGIKIIVTIDGTGRVFDIVTLLIALGSGIGLFTVASIVCDSLLRFFIKEDKVYDIKYDKSFVTETETIFRKLTRKLSSRLKINPASGSMTGTGGSRPNSSTGHGRSVPIPQRPGKANIQLGVLGATNNTTSVPPSNQGSNDSSPNQQVDVKHQGSIDDSDAIVVPFNTD